MKKSAIIILSFLINVAFGQQLHLNLGSSANDKTGDPLRTAMQKVESNFNISFDSIRKIKRYNDSLQILSHSKQFLGNATSNNSIKDVSGNNNDAKFCQAPAIAFDTADAVVSGYWRLTGSTQFISSHYIVVNGGTAAASFYDNQTLLFTTGNVYNVRIFDTTGNLIHWYPCCEGGGDSLHDVLHQGSTYTLHLWSSFNTLDDIVWTTQDRFDYASSYGCNIRYDEIATNRDFSSGTTGWSTAGGTPTTFAIESGKLHYKSIVGDALTYGRFSYGFHGRIGNKYRLQMNANVLNFNFLPGLCPFINIISNKCFWDLGSIHPGNNEINLEITVPDLSTYSITFYSSDVNGMIDVFIDPNFSVALKVIVPAYYYNQSIDVHNKSISYPAKGLNKTVENSICSNIADTSELLTFYGNKIHIEGWVDYNGTVTNTTKIIATNHGLKTNDLIRIWAWGSQMDNYGKTSGSNWYSRDVYSRYFLVNYIDANSFYVNQAYQELQPWTSYFRKISRHFWSDSTSFLARNAADFTDLLDNDNLITHSPSDTASINNISTFDSYTQIPSRAGFYNIYKYYSNYNVNLTPFKDALRIVNPTAHSISFRVNINNGLWYTRNEILHQINALPFSSRLEKIMYWMLARTMTDYSLSSSYLQSDPFITLNSNNLNMCGNIINTTGEICRWWGLLFHRIKMTGDYEGGVWDKGKLRYVNINWRHLYYKTNDTIATPEEIVADSLLHFEPVKLQYLPTNGCDSTDMMALFWWTQLKSFYHSTIVPYDRKFSKKFDHFTLPAGANIQFGINHIKSQLKVWHPDSVYTTNVGSAQAVMTVPSGVTGIINAPFMLVYLEGTGVFRIYNKNYNTADSIQKWYLQKILKYFEIPQSGIEIISSTTTIRLTYLVNPRAFTLLNKTNIKIYSDNTGLTVDKVALGAGDRLPYSNVRVNIANDLNGNITWSHDLMNWFNSGEIVSMQYEAGAAQEYQIYYKNKTGGMKPVMNTICLGSSNHLYTINSQANTLGFCCSPRFQTSNSTPFSGSTDVYINALNGESIYYTTNGAFPTTSSTLYTGAIHLTATTTIKAVSYKTNYQRSNMISRIYTKL